MAVIKCKMCGGNLDLTEGASTAQCEFCGSVQTVPKADDEKKLTLFTRANRLRAACEFDKAAGIYETIVADFPDESEAYWGLVLCKYGIEYVDDPATGKKIPTCHRSDFESVLKDENFEQAQENADPFAQKVLRQEAKAIDALRSDIIAVSSKEDPYDIFICYKETDLNGQRTLDSVLAQDLYDALTDKGYRVFFSRISLEDKLGTEYEPYIFAALNSARIMLVVGTEYEHFNAVWVKNEWSRLQKLMYKDKEKHLIPCFKGVDAYDMPEEFARLQAQDLGKMGAIQDILRGIAKLLQKQEPIYQEPSASGMASPLLDRAFLFLEDGDWTSAEDYCERVLDMDPRNAVAYLGKLMVKQQVHTPEELGNCAASIANDTNYQKALRFAPAPLKRQLEDYELVIQNRLEAERKAEEAKHQSEALLLKAQETSKKASAEETKARLRALREKYAPASRLICAGDSHSVCLQTNGTLLALGWNHDDQCVVFDWNEVVAISAGRNHTVALLSDGTVNATGYNIFGQCDVDDWMNMRSVHACDYLTYGLQADGTLVAVGENSQVLSRYWDLVAISGCSYHTVGLRADGTVVAKGDNSYNQCNVSNWTEIVAICTGENHTIGLRADGTLVATGNGKYGQCDVSDWTDIIAIAGNSFHTVGLRANGTVVATGRNIDLANVTCWKDIIAISAGLHHTLGLRSDGIVVAAGDNHYGQCDVNGLKLFENYDNFAQEREKAMSIAADRRARGVCQQCGGQLKGLFTRKCIYCGQEKDY